MATYPRVGTVPPQGTYAHAVQYLNNISAKHVTNDEWSYHGAKFAIPPEKGWDNRSSYQTVINDVTRIQAGVGNGSGGGCREGGDDAEDAGRCK